MSIWNILKPPNEEQQSAIRKGLKEDEEKLEINLKLLEEWIESQEYLPKNYDKRILKAYVRGAKHILEDAKRKIETYFIARNLHTDLFGKRILTTDKDLKAMTFMHSVTMPNITIEGYRITIIKTFDNNAEKFDPLAVLRLAILMCELRCHEENFLAGEIIIFDCEFITPLIATKMLTSQLKKALIVIQEAFPVLVKQVHLITDQSVLVNSVNLLKQFMKEKVRNRIHIHKNYQSLKNVIEPKCLPCDYGGTQNSLDELSSRWQTVLENYGSLFEKIDCVRLAGPIPKNFEGKSVGVIDGDWGLEGSFRKLNID